MKKFFIFIGVSLAGCAGPRPEIPATLPAGTEPAATAPATTPAQAPLPGVPLRLGNRDILYLTDITAHLSRKSVSHSVSRRPTSTGPATSEPGSDVVFSYTLMPTETGAPPMTCQLILRDGGRQASVTVESRSKLPALSLTAVLPSDVYPSRYRLTQGTPACQLAIGPATRLIFDSLYDTTSADYVTFWGKATFESTSKGYTLKTRTDATTNKQTVLLRLELLPTEKAEARPKRLASSLAQLAPPTPFKRARQLVTEWAFSPTDDEAAMPSPAEAIQRLPADRAELLRCIDPRQLVRRAGRLESAAVCNLAIGRPPLQWNVLYLNNSSSRCRTESVSLKSLGIIAPTGCRLAVYDFWQEQLVGIIDDAFEVDLPAEDCRVLSVRDVRPNEPSIVSTSRHITQGLPDLTDVAYDGRSMTLSGKSAIDCGEAYELRILLPVGQQTLDIAEVEAGSVSPLVRADGPLRIVTLESNTAQLVAWRVHFKKASLPAALPPRPERMVSQQNTRGVLLTWDSGESRPARYRVYRDGRLLASVPGSENQYQDNSVDYDAEYAYTIRSVDWAGRESDPLPQAVHRTPVPADAYLTQLVPLSTEQARRAPAANRSAGGNPLRMAGRRYNRGLGALTGTRIEYFLGKGYERFSGEVGVDDDTVAKGRARFEIYGDGRLLFRSEALTAGQKPQRFEVSVRGCRALALVVVDADGGTAEIHADWGDTYLRTSRAPGR
jgi:hypothetical protein